MGRTSGHAWRAGLVGLASACAPAEELEPLPIDVCGQAAPKQILALGDDEFVDPNAGVARFGDRWLFGVQRFEIPLTSIQSTTSLPQDRPFAQIEARVESVGPCGEDRRVVAEDVDFLIQPETDDAAWLGCRMDTGDLYWIDPDGAWPARPIGRAVFCPQVAVRGHDVFFLAAETGEFIHARLSDDGVAVDVLVSDVVQTSGFYALVDGEGVPSQDVYLLRGEARVLVRLDFATLALEDVIDRIDEFSISPDRQWLLRIRRIPDDPNDTGTPTATLVILSDRSEIGFLYGELRLDVRGFIGESFAWVQGLDGAGLPLQTTIITIPSLRVQHLEGSVSVRGSDGDDLAVISTPNSATEVLEMSTGDRRSLVEHNVFVQDGVITYENETPYADLDVPDEHRPFDTVRMPLATLEPEVAYERLFSYVELPDNRWLTHSAIDANQLADLVLVDGDTLEIRTVDRNTVPSLRSYDPDLDLEYGEPWRTDDIVYQVHERASDRGGIWRVRFTD